MFDKFTSLEHTQQFSKENSWSFESFCSLKHLHNSFLISYKGRNKTEEVILYKQNLEENLFYLRKNLLNFTYRHRKYRTFIVEDSKKRVINAPSFEDHILHHAIFSFLENIFEKKFIENSFANRVGKGSHKAILKLQNQSRKYNLYLKRDMEKNKNNFSNLYLKSGYYLKLDITKYFYSVDQEILFEQIKRHVKDEKLLHYVKIIIDSYLETNIINPLTSNRTGMPIGNVTSQLFANIYLHDLDFYVEHIIKPLIRKENKDNRNSKNYKKDIFYIRYVDDFVFLAKNKEDLTKIKRLVLTFLENKLKLSVSSKKLILNRIDCGIPFLGYNILTSKKTKIILNNSNHITSIQKLKIRNDTIRRFKRKIRDYSNDKKLNSLISFKGHCDLANPNLIKSLVNSTLNLSSNKKYKYKKLLKIIYDSGSRKQEIWEELILLPAQILIH